MPKKILVVDDEKPISDIIKFNLTKEGFDVETAYDGEEAVEKVEEYNPDLMILDLMLPKKDGLEVAREVRQTHDMPIIMVTAKGAEIDKVLGQQKEKEQENNDIQLGNLVIKPDAYLVEKNGSKIELTHREFELLYYMAQHLDQVMTREHLLQTVWGYDYFGDVRTVDVTVHRLREKIEDDPVKPKILVTRRGVGYFVKGQTEE